MPEVWIPTEDLVCISAIEAQWLSVDALFISRSRDLDFEDVYLGNLSLYYKAWAENEMFNGRQSAPASELMFFLSTEHLRSIVTEEQNTAFAVIEKDVEPLRRVLEGVLSGASKAEAMSKIADAYRTFYRAELLSDPEFRDNLPKVVNHTSKPRLEALWTKYADVFHYILMWHVGRLRASAGIDLEPVPDARKIQRKVAKLVSASSRTRPLILPDPVLLRFCTREEYAAHKKILKLQLGYLSRSGLGNIRSSTTSMGVAECDLIFLSVTESTTTTTKSLT